MIRVLLVVGILVQFGIGMLTAQQAPQFLSVQRQTNSDVTLQIASTSGKYLRLEGADRLPEWHGLQTYKSTGTNPIVDGSSAVLGTRFYRVVEVEEATPLTGDHLVTDDGEAVIHPINHASFVMRWKDRYVYNDPVGGSSPYTGIPRASLILISHSHSDHFDAATLSAVKQNDTVIIAPAAVYSSLSVALKAQTIPLSNGSSTNVLGIQVEAIPAYNANHPKGTGNGYVVTLGGRRIFMSGDTGNIAEMRALTDIDVAFVCMNVPFTMTLAEAVTAVRAFRPRVTYPYHYRNQDNTQANVASFRQQISADPSLEVRLRKWY